MLMGGFYVLMFNWANLPGYPLQIRAAETARFLSDAMTGGSEQGPPVPAGRASGDEGAR